MGAITSRIGGAAEKKQRRALATPVREPFDLIPNEDLLRKIVYSGLLRPTEWPSLSCVNRAFKAYNYKPRYLLMRGIGALTGQDCAPNEGVARTFFQLAAAAGVVEAHVVLGGLMIDTGALGGEVAAEMHLREALAAEGDQHEEHMFIMTEPPSNAFDTARVKLAAILYQRSLRAGLEPGRHAEAKELVQVVVDSGPVDADVHCPMPAYRDACLWLARLIAMDPFVSGDVADLRAAPARALEVLANMRAEPDGAIYDIMGKMHKSMSNGDDDHARQAFENFLKASERGVGTAGFDLGELWENLHGVPEHLRTGQHLVTAYTYYMLGALRGKDPRAMEKANALLQLPASDPNRANVEVAVHNAAMVMQGADQVNAGEATIDGLLAQQ